MKVYRLNVSIIGISRVLRGFEASEASTFGQLHDAIFHALNRHDPRAYAFYVTKTVADDRKARLKAPLIIASNDAKVDVGRKQASQPAADTTLGAVGLVSSDVLYYLFDFNEEWWHRIDVASVTEQDGDVPPIRVAESVGGAPPQYKEQEEDDDHEEDEEDYDDEG